MIETTGTQDRGQRTRHKKTEVTYTEGRRNGYIRQKQRIQKRQKQRAHEKQKKQQTYQTQNRRAYNAEATRT